MIFRTLSSEEEKEFRDYAKTNDPEPGKWSIYHPVCREEWTKRGFDRPKESETNKNGND